MANPTIVVSAGGNAIQWSAGGSFNVTEKCYTCQGSMPEGSSFCPTCGTTLFWKPKKDGPFTVTTGSLDDPAAFPPKDTNYDEDRLPWEPHLQIDKE